MGRSGGLSGRCRAHGRLSRVRCAVVHAPGHAGVPLECIARRRRRWRGGSHRAHERPHRALLGPTSGHLHTRRSRLREVLSVHRVSEDARGRGSFWPDRLHGRVRRGPASDGHSDVGGTGVASAAGRESRSRRRHGGSPAASPRRGSSELDRSAYCPAIRPQAQATKRP